MFSTTDRMIPMLRISFIAQRSLASDMDYLLWLLKMTRVSIRQFNREMFYWIKRLPITVYNKKTKVNLFEVKKVS